MASSLYRLSKSSVSHTTNSEDALSVSSECSGEEEGILSWLKYAPKKDNHERVPTKISISHDVDYYLQKLDFFVNADHITYALTVSPQNTPLMRNKKPLQQVEILKRICSEVFDKYDASYSCVFEFYKNMTDIHVHGFISVPKVKNIDEIKRDLRNILFRNSPPTGKLKEIPIQVKKQGRDMRQGWYDYCKKDLEFMVKNSINPFFKIKF